MRFTLFFELNTL